MIEQTSFLEDLTNPLGLSSEFIQSFQTSSSFETPKYTGEFWTAKQRQSHSLHEISYRACFKPQLPHFFIIHLTKENDVVYDPFLGRGTTLIEAALLNRQVIGNDINPLSQILCQPRLLLPNLNELESYLSQIPFDQTCQANIDLSMFYESKTLGELVSLQKFLLEKEARGSLNLLDNWIRMIATNRLTGHSKGFFSVYTLPPNQAVTPERQMKINKTYQQAPEYRDVKKLILKKTKSLLRQITKDQRRQLYKVAETALFLNEDTENTKQISDSSIKLTVTSPPFLNVVQYAQDNWLRCWFNGIDAKKIEGKITMSNNVKHWQEKMQKVFHELYRVTKQDGYVAFEVGEVKKGQVKLDEVIVPVGIKSGFQALGVFINTQEFTKTANIWKVNNNKRGTNTNRIVVFQK